MFLGLLGGKIGGFFSEFTKIFLLQESSIAVDKLLPPNHGQRITPLLVPRLLSPGLFKPETAFILKHFSFEFDLLLKLFKIYFTRMYLEIEMT